MNSTDTTILAAISFLGRAFLFLPVCAAWPALALAGALFVWFLFGRNRLFD